MRVKLKSKVIPTSFKKIEGRGGVRWGKRPERGRWLVELVGDQKQGPKASPRSKIRREKREQRRYQGKSEGEE